MREDNEATIFLNFLVFLQSKRSEMIFNVPRGKMDLLEESRVKFFLAMNGQNKEKIAEPLRARGWRAFPFFVIDPYDRSSFPTIDTGLLEGEPQHVEFIDLINASVRLIREGKFLIDSKCVKELTN